MSLCARRLQQWHRSLVKRPFNAGAVLCRRPLLSIAAHDSLQQSRFLSQDVSRKKGPEDGSFAHACTVLTRDPSGTSADHLLSHLKPAVPRKSPDSDAFDSTKVPPPGDVLAVILFTPSYARLASNEAFIPKLLDRFLPDLQERAKDQGKLQALVAVVDRLPDNKYRPNEFEGISVFATDNPDSILQLGTTVNAVADDGGPKTLSFSFYDFANTAQFLHKSDAPPIHSVLRRVELPLANTVFHNGLDATLIAYEFGAGMGDEPTLINKAHLHSQSVKWPFTVRSSAKPSASFSKLQLDLVPLTMPRKIQAIMGNIVRRLSPFSAPDADFPASKELEENVSRYFQATGQAPHAMPVWALVVPQDVFPKVGASAKVDSFKGFKQRFGTDPKQSLEEVFAALWKHGTRHLDIRKHIHSQGSRLHKVISGGGGWGKKAGLLSLDPKSSFTPVPESVETFGDEMPWANGWDDGLANIAEEGDYIQFFAAATVPTTTELPESSVARQATFGTIPSMIDSMINDHKEVDVTAGREELLVCDDFFGALSEQGIAATTALVSETEEQLASTKIDVPYSTLQIYKYHSDPLPPALNDINFRLHIASRAVRQIETGVKEAQDKLDRSFLRQRSVKELRQAYSQVSIKGPYFRYSTTKWKIYWIRIQYQSIRNSISRMRSLLQDGEILKAADLVTTTKSQRREYSAPSPADMDAGGSIRKLNGRIKAALEQRRIERSGMPPVKSRHSNREHEVDPGQSDEAYTASGKAQSLGRTQGRRKPPRLTKALQKLQHSGLRGRYFRKYWDITKDQQTDMQRPGPQEDEAQTEARLPSRYDQQSQNEPDRRIPLSMSLATTSEAPSRRHRDANRRYVRKVKSLPKARQELVNPNVGSETAQSRTGQELVRRIPGSVKKTAQNVDDVPKAELTKRRWERRQRGFFSRLADDLEFDLHDTP